MENYYQEVLQEIRENIQAEKYEDASFLIRREMEMPYIPPDVEKELRHLEGEVRFGRSEKAEEHEVSMETLLHQLKGRPESQLTAADALRSRNLRLCIDEIKDWLSKDPNPEASALIMEALALQGIDEEFVLNRNGVEYTFWSSDIVPPVSSGGFREADGYLKKWLVHYPQYYETARIILIHEVYMFLPLSYEKGEGRALAEMCIKQIFDETGDENLLNLIPDTKI